MRILPIFALLVLTGCAAFGTATQPTQGNLSWQQADSLFYPLKGGEDCPSVPQSDIYGKEWPSSLLRIRDDAHWRMSDAINAGDEYSIHQLPVLSAYKNMLFDEADRLGRNVRFVATPHCREVDGVTIVWLETEMAIVAADFDKIDGPYRIGFSWNRPPGGAFGHYVFFKTPY